MPTTINILIILVSLLAFPLQADDIDSQRENFIAAQSAWQNNELEIYTQLKASLHDYPLFAYLEYAELKQGFDTAEHAQIERFIETYRDTAVGQTMRLRYLNQLASRNQSQTFLNWFDAEHDIAPEIVCKQITARINVGQGKHTSEQINAIWLTASSRPKSCDPVFSYWKKNGNLTSDLVWQRIDLAIRHGKPKLAKSLSKYLKRTDRHWLNRWIKLRTHAQSALTQLQGSHPFKGKMIGYGLARLAETDADKALAMHARLASKLTGEQRCDSDARLARALQRQDGEAVYDFFKTTNPCPDHVELDQARLTAALLRQRWDDVAAWYLAAPDVLRAEQKWRYWYARALAQTDKPAKANKHFGQLIQDRSFYAYLAADQIGVDYHWNHTPATTTKAVLEQMRTHPAILRMRELYHHQADTDARREWNLLIKQLDKQELIAAAIVFDSWGRHDRAIFTISLAGYWDDLNIRFPVKYQQLVTAQAQQQHLERSWVFAILRQESAFMEDANSAVGALGLMQLMPNTARHVAKQQNIKRPLKKEILTPALNVRLGAGYLAEMLHQFGNIALATAAYNAGPHRVSRWLYGNSLPGDIWIELIPFKETRRYVQRVMTYASIYDRRLDEEHNSLTSRIGTIPAITSAHTR